MCGIVGFVQRQQSPETLHRMLRRVRHRGPDGAGEWFSEHEGWHVALGHRRLAIIDVKGGRQPLGNEDGSLQITYNGEVYNFHALRAALEAREHRFATRSDTEVIVHHYEEHGLDGLADLNGMFAFAIWNADRGELVLARDRAGIKPLYYAQTADGGLVFASELATLLEHKSLSSKLSVDGVARYFFSDYAQSPQTLVQGASRLAPGHYLVWREGKLSQQKPFWRLRDVQPHTPALSVDALAHEFWERTSAAVKRQMVSDVPIGIFLSGGIDSAIVATLAQAHSDRPLRTFSITFEDERFDERTHSRMMAAFLKSHHTEEVINEPALLETIDSALAALDEPLGDPSYLPTFLLSRLAAQYVKVTLGGDGGDELWAGYPTYRAHGYAQLYQHIPKLVREQLINRAVARLSASDGYQSWEWKAKRFALRWDDDPILRHLRWMSNTDLTDLPAIIPSAGAIPLGGWAQPIFNDYVNSMLALDFSTYLPGSVLAKVDRASMAHGLEVRPPLLDNQLIDWAFSLPGNLKLRGATGKYLLRAAARPHLPEEIVLRAKQGFAIPLAKWLKGSLKPRLEALLESSPLWQTGILHRNTFVEWNRQHQNGRHDRSRPLWSLIVLDAWLRRR